MSVLRTKKKLKMLSVSIIIINYNTCQMTKECIDSVFNNTMGIDFEIILVDNASSDESKSVFTQDSRIRYIYSEENLGFGKANNLGVVHARGRNIFFLNSDTLLINNAVKIISDYLDRDSDCGICGGNLYDKEGLPTHSFYRYYQSFLRDVFRPLFNLSDSIRYGKNQFHNHSGQVLEVCQISGADLMLRKSIIDKIGCFDPAFFMYYEDSELCYRVLKNGYKIVSVPDAKIQHLCGKSDKKGIANIWRAESRDIYYNLTGKSLFYRKVDAMYWKTVCRMVKFKYRHDSQIVDVYNKCIHYYNQLLFKPSK